jgi:cobalamin biosynthesis protein CobT
MAAPKPHDLESTLGKIARVLTGQYGVTVAFSPDGPRVERGRIVIPEFDVSHDLARDIVTGYLDLLVARAKFSSLDDLAALDSGVTRRVAQVIEDRRVCAQLLENYPGARGFLGRLRQHAAREATARWHALSWRDRLIWRVERALWDEAATSKEHSESLDATLSASEDAIQQGRASRSTGESVAASKALIARIRALAAGDVNTMMFTADGAEDFDPERVAGEFDSAPSSLDTDTDTNASDAVSMGQSPSGAALDEGDASPGAPPREGDLVDGRPRLSVPLATEFDQITDLTGQGDAAAWRKLRALARAETGPLAARLERALKADEQTHWKHEQERGEIDRPALAKLATSPGYRTPFRVKRVTQGRDAAVTILIDRSGSMAGRKIELARLCAAALGDALTQLGFASEVLGYSSIESAGMRALLERERAAGADLSRYNRLVERLDFQVYKRFGSTNLNGLSAIECGHENPDGEALSWAAARLADQRAGRRILMVLSDGYPATGDGHPAILRTDLRARIESIGRKGIELIGVGILDDAVESFYPHNIVVRKLDELPVTAFGILSELLLRRPGMAKR